MSIIKIENDSPSVFIDLASETPKPRSGFNERPANIICSRKSRFFDTPQELFNTFMLNKTSTKHHKPKPIYVHSEKYENIEKLLKKTGRTLKVTKKEDNEIMRKLFKVKSGSRSQVRVESLFMTSRLSDPRMLHRYRL